MAHYLLFYEKGAGYEERQKKHADEHRAYLGKLVDEGTLILAGNLENPTDGSALLLFTSAEAAERCAKGDPYVVHGIISKWTVRKWDAVIGAGLQEI